MQVSINSLKHNTSQFIMDWDSVRKGKMIGYLSIGITIWYVLGGSLIYHSCQLLNVAPQHRMSDFGYQFILGFGVLYLSLCVFSIFLGNHVTNKSKQAKKNYMYWCMLLYTGGNVVVCHMFGELSLPTGIMMAGGPMIGWILFNHKGVIFSVIFACLLIIPLFLLTFFDVLDYAPIVPQDTNLHKNISYNIMIACIILPHVGSLLSLAYLSINHWRRREEHANYLAGTDSLTNVPNRRQFFSMLYDAIEETKNHQQPLAIMMLDIDRFKYINDNFGHMTGDDVLNQTIKILRSCLRKQDMIGRFGGDEFVVLLPNTEPKNAEKITQKCLETIKNTNITTDNGVFNITASFGVTVLETVEASYNPDTLSRLLINQADSALYSAKRNGRNCFVINL